MGRFLRLIKGKGRFLVAAALATLVGGVAAGAVMAAIPDASGIIHGCYRNSGNVLNPKGSVRIIDSDVNETCTTNETALTWNQTGPQGPPGTPGSPGAPGAGQSVKVIIEGQELGEVIDKDGTFFYEPLQRMVPINFAMPVSSEIAVVHLGEPTSIVYESNDCTGTPHAAYLNGLLGLNRLHTSLLTVGFDTFFIANPADSPTSMVPQSMIGFDYTTGFSCVASDGLVKSVVPVTPVTLPIDEPIESTLRFERN